ncbi:TRC40/GET3/ArsA family transport-energizing ATPase [Haloferax sp. MBLA0076]|uniref:TRC40/GET3/ArsA family transport-energizing ATPase n=1 Tax=Haloferax litoreum TaxID=2666140 RepID=A0A6A8GEZ7_9EURY|nr:MULTISPECIES: ArsA family ATPase [Haloferax]KAB1192934.1 AAA family ATPase [Haloferax sp. CBA1148]MRX21421.1 TRC40/GET3/ArsA family transport-energizing ATPase [Haloferax litoreum]
MRKFVFFGGKGGVGKTTMSSAYAVKCARAGVSTLLVSTDPAHSTRDVFDQSFTDTPEPVEDEPNLDAMEIDPETEVREHLMETKRALGEQVSPAMVNEIDRQIEMAHQTPGAHESALFDRFIDVMRDSDQYDRIVFDTSPTGGTLRLLSLPEYLDGWIQRLLHKRKQSVKLFERAAIGNNEPRRMMEGDPIIARLEQRRDDFNFAKEMLQSQAAFFLVVNPDELSIRETKRAVEQLDDYGLDVRGLAVNRLTPEPDPDEQGRGATFLRNRVKTEQERLRELREDLSPPLVAAIETRVAEVKGDFLGEVADEIEVGVELTTN